jgi:hypothetical protein
MQAALRNPALLEINRIKPPVPCNVKPGRDTNKGAPQILNKWWSRAPRFFETTGVVVFLKKDALKSVKVR